MKDLDFKYDDSNLQKLFKELEPKQRVKTLRAAFRIAGNKVRKAAVSNIRQSLNSNKELEKGVKVKVWKRYAGFRVTVGSGYYQSKRFSGQFARKVPVLRWADTGTDARKTKRKSALFGKGRKSHATGRVKRYGFMAKTLSQVESSVTGYIQDSVIMVVKRTAKKYGCR